MLAVKRYDRDNNSSGKKRFFPKPYLVNLNRDYDSSGGIYLQPDRLDALGRTNDPELLMAAQMGVVQLPTRLFNNQSYGYAAQNPVMNTDVDGLWPFGMPGKSDAQTQGPTILQQNVPTLTPQEAKQLSDAIIKELDWGDVKNNSDLKDLPRPDTLNDLPPDVRKRLCQWLKDNVSSGNQSGVDKVCQECEKP